MQIEIAKMERMAERGSSLLRLIQNSHTPLLDLLIRESIQNSTDAAKNSSSPVRYDISVKKINRDAVTYFEGISGKLEEKFSEGIQKSIVIRDSNTTGLTGPLHHSYIKNNSYGNLLKLVYEISMPQEKKEAGGSWGLGKTVYFRLGIGLVLYYSRIKQDDGTYQSRLAACMVEDESKQDTILPYQPNVPRRGIAWWGQMHPDGSTMPVTNEAEISKILSDFNIIQYRGVETGTTVIIPFINPDKLIPLSESESENENWWHKDIELYLDIAIQRWYAPRIDNKYYPYGNYLNPSVNGKIINKDNMEPIFSIFRTLYIAATKGIQIVPETERKNITVKDIELHRSLAKTKAGSAAFLKVDKEKLQMVIPHNKKSPFDYLDISHSPESSNPPIVAYLRRPAMVVNFETEGKWANGVDKTNPDEYIIALFVPDSENTLTGVNEDISLDEYLRRGEKADHTSWADITIEDRKHTIVERIQKRVAQSIREAFNSDAERANVSKSHALSKSLAKFFLPPEGFGKSPSIPPRGGGGSSMSKKKTGKLEISDITIDNSGTMNMNFEIILPKGIEQLIVEVLIDSEGNSKISGEEWESNDVIGTPFPVEVKGVNLLSFNKNKPDSALFNIDILTTQRYKVKNKFIIKINAQTGELKGNILLHNSDPMIHAYMQEELVGFKGGNK